MCGEDEVHMGVHVGVGARYKAGFGARACLLATLVISEVLEIRQLLSPNVAPPWPPPVPTCGSECSRASRQGLNPHAWVACGCMRQFDMKQNRSRCTKAWDRGHDQRKWVLSKAQSEAGHACGRMKCARGCIQVHGADSARSSGHAFTTVSVAELPVHARLSNYA